MTRKEIDERQTFLNAAQVKILTAQVCKGKRLPRTKEGDEAYEALRIAYEACYAAKESLEKLLD